MSISQYIQLAEGTWLGAAAHIQTAVFGSPCKAGNWLLGHLRGGHTGNSILTPYTLLTTNTTGGGKGLSQYRITSSRLLAEAQHSTAGGSQVRAVVILASFKTLGVDGSLGGFRHVTVGNGMGRSESAT